MIPFSPPRIHPDVIKEIEETLLSGWITTGPKVRKFESEITAYTRCKITNCVNSATAGMEMVLRWFGVGEGDEVIIPAYTYCATANVITHLGATPVMVDINSDNFNISCEAIRKTITEKTKVIIPVDIGGIPADHDKIMEIARSNRLFKADNKNQKVLGRILVMADSAHSFGAGLNNKPVGSTCDATVFSFHAVKNLTTAEGGAICWNLPDFFNHEELFKHINTRILHGQSKDALAKSQAGGWRYDVEEPGYKCNMTDIHACLGLIELKRYDENLTRRAQIIRSYDEAFSQFDWAITPNHFQTDRRSSMHLYMLRIGGATENQRDQIIEEISKHKVSVNVHFIPLPLLTAYKKRGFDIEDYPNTYNAFANEISLPVYFDLSDEQVETVIQTVATCVNKVLNG